MQIAPQRVRRPVGALGSAGFKEVKSGTLSERRVIQEARGTAGGGRGGSGGIRFPQSFTIRWRDEEKGMRPEMLLFERIVHRRREWYKTN